MNYETHKKIPKRLARVEELFDVAESVLEECQIPEDSPDEPVMEITPLDQTTELSNPSSDNLPRIFDLQEVRHDFIIARRNLYKLLDRCQNLMDGVGKLDIDDLKAGQVESIAFLANSINMQINTVMKLYRDMAAIEELRTPPEFKGKSKKSEEEIAAVYVGDSNSLLEIIKANS